MNSGDMIRNGYLEARELRILEAHRNIQAIDDLYKEDQVFHKSVFGEFDWRIDRTPPRSRWLRFRDFIWPFNPWALRRLR